MANNIKGITIEIGGETTKLESALKDVNKSIKDTQSQLKDVDKLLKLDPTNIELLAQKQELLKRTTEETAKKLETLKKAQDQMNASGVDILSDEYMALNREIIATEQSMRDLESQTAKTNTTILKVTSSLSEVADKTEKMSKATKGLSTAAAGAVGGLVAMGIKAGKDADDLNTLAKQTGLSTEALQKMQYASDLIDVDVESITGSLKRMKKQLDSGEDKFNAIGVSVKDTNGQFRDVESIFYDVISALGQIQNETERDTVAMDLFGRSADDLAGILDDGGAALKALGDEAKNTGAIISQEDLDKANAFNDELDKIKAQLSGQIGQAAVSIAQALLPLMEKITPLVIQLAQWLGNLSPTTVTIVGVLLTLIAVLSPILSIVSKLSTALPLIIPVITAISAPVWIVIGAVTALIAVFALIIKNWDDIKAKAVELKDTLVSTFKNIVENIKSAWDNLKLKFPNIKLPHFKISGSLSLNPPSVPKIGVDWYRKAYDDAYLLNSPTIFGMQGNTLLGGGEGNGSEAVVGTEKLMSMMSEVVGNANNNVTVVLEGDAQGIFNLVRVQNSKFMKSNGYSPLM